MPSGTFYNLRESKKQRIFSASVQEFATRRFSDASINQIGKEKMSIALPRQPSKAEDFFDTYLKMVRDILSWTRERPLYSKIWMLMELDDSAFITKLPAQFPDPWSRLRVLIQRDKELGRIRPDVDSDMVIQILNNQNLYFQKTIRQGNLDDLLRQVEELIKIIRGGIAIV